MHPEKRNSRDKDTILYNEYEEGIQARKNGKEFTDNPYTDNLYGSITRWESGYTHQMKLDEQSRKPLL